MNAFEAECYEKYPVFLKEMSLDEMQSCMAFGFSCGEGWYKALDEFFQSVETLNSLLFQLGWPDYAVVAKQIKEKYGLITVFWDIETPEEFNKDVSDSIYKHMMSIESSLEFRCVLTCEKCGKVSSDLKRTKGWISYLCEDCYRERESRKEVGSA